jgi:hypothetical protein
MITRLAITLLLLAFGASIAGAAGLNLAWTVPPGTADNCPSVSGSNFADASDSCSGLPNANKHYLVASLVAPSGLTQVTGEDVMIDMHTALPVLPDYWQVQTGGCRAGSLSLSNSFASFDQTTCVDYWGSNSSGGFHWTSGYGGPGQARLEGVFAVPLSAAGPMSASREYYLVWALIRGGSSPSCVGCQVPACWVLSQVTMSQPAGVGDVVVVNPATRNQVTWQGGLGASLTCSPEADAR